MPTFPPGASEKGGAAAAATHVEQARQFYAPIIPLVAELRRQGLSLRAIARALGERGIKTRQEWDHWSAQQVARVLARADQSSKKNGS
jgi:transposase-like protein